jgi:CheY-like chemotaxis protein
MESPNRGVKYTINCPNCNARYDAITASWCNCIGKDLTLLCTSCGQCFCRASQSFRSTFWNEAPKEMRDRRRREVQEPAQFANPPEDQIIRPMVLMVEDDRVVQAIAGRVISGMGYGVAVASDGEEGLRLARQYHPEVVLTDAMMPKLDGREMGRIIKQDPTMENTKVVVITSLYTGSRYRAEALDTYKADAFLTKPLHADQLRQLLQTYLGSPPT